MSKYVHGFFITIISMILYFKHIIHIDDFPLKGHPPSTMLNLRQCLADTHELHATLLSTTLMSSTHVYHNNNKKNSTLTPSCQIDMRHQCLTTTRQRHTAMELFLTRAARAEATECTCTRYSQTTVCLLTCISLDVTRTWLNETVLNMSTRSILVMGLKIMIAGTLTCKIWTDPPQKLS